MKKKNRKGNERSSRKQRSLRRITSPLTPAKAEVQSQELDARLRGHERSLVSAAPAQQLWGCMAGTVIFLDADLTEPTEAWGANEDEALPSPRSKKP
jgi:hypothetical protein